MTTLDLNDAGFKKIDVKKYLNLEMLLLKNNKLNTLEDSGIHNLEKLCVLDLRNNHLNKLEEIVNIIRSLPELKTIGLSGNFILSII